MALLPEWQIAPARQPRPADYRYDLDQVLASAVGLRAVVPENAFTAGTLGTERAGSGVVIRDGVVLTIGYLITEAEEVWLSLNDGRSVPGHPLGYDQVTGFGLIQALDRMDIQPLPLGSARAAKPGTPVVIAGGGGRKHAVASFIVGKQEFAGYWEYVLDEALFTAPAHPFWGGTAVIGPAGDIIGIGSLQVEHRTEKGETGHLNMVVPIDLLKPILGDLIATGRANRPPRPWLGLFATEIEGRIFVVGTYEDGPAAAAGIKQGDLVLAVAGEKVSDLAQFFRHVWTLGEAGVEVPLTLHRDGQTFQAAVTSGDRDRYLKAPRLHS
jgi:S1-C subfamily serine protease